MSSSSGRIRRWSVAAVIAAVLAAPSVPALGAVLTPGEPMVAKARSIAERSPSSLQRSSVTPADEAAALVAEAARLTNLERVAAGLPALVVHPAVEAAAAAHSYDQSVALRMSHQGSDGSDGGDRLTRAGFAWAAWGENVAAGQRTADEVVTGWMGSASHRANILNGTFTTIGIGVATGADGNRYWTMVLAA